MLVFWAEQDLSPHASCRCLHSVFLFFVFLFSILMSQPPSSSSRSHSYNRISEFDSLFKNGFIWILILEALRVQEWSAVTASGRCLVTESKRDLGQEEGPECRGVGKWHRQQLLL